MLIVVSSGYNPTIGSVIPVIPLFLHSDFYINISLEATYMQTWNGLPQPLRDLML